MTNATVRTRFAPSPTGHLHIGNARTAIMNWLFARHTGGIFILRIEDTDKERSTLESEKNILDDLRWLGLTWDEGLETGGSLGPYRQSERLQLYKDHAVELEKSEKVYPCYCTPEELENRRKERLAKGESAVYDGRCRQLTGEERSKLETEGRKPSFRFRVDDIDTLFDDLIKGAISFQGENIGDFIIMRPDGMPMYNFACTVDDHLMQITHVVRGDDHISNTPRQILLCRAFGWDVPIFAHIPMILGGDKVRLSKRHGATSVAQYREAGYLPEALVNFLSLLSWSSESGDEILSADRLIQEFDFARVSKSAAVFDVEKLDWMNGQYIRNLDVGRFAEMIFPFLKKEGFPVHSATEIEPIANALQEKVERLSQISEKVKPFFQNKVKPEDAEAELVLQQPEAKVVLTSFQNQLQDVTNWNSDTFRLAMKHVQNETGIKGKNLWMSVRVALTGQVHGPDLSKTIEILGLDKCRRFVQAVLE